VLDYKILMFLHLFAGVCQHDFCSFFKFSESETNGRLEDGPAVKNFSRRALAQAQLSCIRPEAWLLLPL
jgi:hypothetical protein